MLQEVSRSRIFQCKGCSLVPLAFLVLGDLLGNLKASERLWNKLVSFPLDDAFRSDAANNDWFNTEYRALRWRDAIGARIVTIYHFEIASPAGGTVLQHN